MALVVNLMGFVGGLVMSAIKRDRGVKDWGAMIEGHGGMLDRVDSVCFSAPMYFHVIRYLWSTLKARHFRLGAARKLVRRTSPIDPASSPALRRSRPSRHGAPTSP
jgi:hypothetical protein